MNNIDSLKLPIKTNASITSECWTYYKLSIIETSPNADAWLASHFLLYFDNNFNAFLGENNSIYNLDYYNDILEYEEIPIERIDPENIIKIIIDEIRLGNYIVVYLPHPRSTIHEIVIHGYDVYNELFFYNYLVNGKFTEISMSFTDFKREHDKVYSFFKKNPFSRVVTSWYFFPVTRLRLKEYKDDMSILKAIRKLRNESNGKKIRVSNVNGEDSNDNVSYTGLGCLVGFEYRLGKYIQDKRFIKGTVFSDLSWRLVNTLFKFFEYYTNIYNTMRWISNELDNANELESIIGQYKYILTEFNGIYMNAIKFSQTENWEVFYKLFERYKGIYPVLKNTLDLFCEKSDDILFEKKRII